MATGKKTASAKRAPTKGKATGRKRGAPPAKSTAKAPKGAANRRSKRNPPKRTASRLTIMDRVHRARTIAAARAKKRPTAWATIAKQVGLSERQCRDIYADFLLWDETQKDPMKVVEETIDCLWAAMLEASDTAAYAEPGSTARTGAVKAFIEAATTRLALMQAAGKVPRYLGTFAAEQELRAVMREFAELLERHEITGPPLREFLELAERVGARRRAELPRVVEGSVAAA